MIEVEALVFEYPGKRALHGLDFTVAPATVTALVGPNGAGKTTLLRCLAALERPFSGRVRIAGLDTAEAPRRVHRQLGYLSDFFGLYDELSVRRCLEYAAMARGVEAGERQGRIATVAEQLGLANRLDEAAGALSRGLRQRLAIAQAIIHQPQVVLLDEPASGLDPEARADLARLINELREQGMTLVVSSHILAELESYSTHMLTLSEGRITAQRALHETQPEQVGLRLVLSRDVPDLAAALGACAGVAALQVDGRSASFRLAGDEEARRRLLAELVGRGLPVSEFAVDRLSLQEVYLADVRRGRVSAEETP